jgi:uncharacterized protein (DUF433 family)
MPKSAPVSLRIRPQLLKEIQKEAVRTDRRASQIIHSTLEEGIRMRRCPGIVFTEGPAGRRATVAGTGIDVWEVIRVFRSCDDDVHRLSRALPQLSRPQLEAALHYYRNYPVEIDRRLESEQEAYEELPSQAFVRGIKL